MIYELKIELFDGQLPITRTIQIHKKTNLRQLHYIIQVAFDWSGLRPHIFLKHMGNQVHAIGDRREVRQPALDFFKDWAILEEKNQSISTWLTEVGDSLVYEYYQNFKKRRFHLIELVQILPVEEGKVYPFCQSSHRLSPKEPYASRSAVAVQGLTSQNINSLTDQVNQLLLQEQTILSEPAVSKGEYYQDQLHRLAFEFLYHQAWNKINESQLISIVDHETEERLFCSVCGADGQDFGLSIFIGEDSFIDLHQSASLYFNGSSADQILDSFKNFYGIGIVFRDEEDIPYNYQGSRRRFNDLWKQLPIEDAKNLIPLYFSYRSGQEKEKKLNLKEMRWLILCMEQILEVHELMKRGLTLPSLAQSNKMLERVYSPIYRQYINQEIHIQQK